MDTCGKPRYSSRRKGLEEGQNERLGKDDPCRNNDTADETKVQVDELRGRLNRVDDGKLGWAFFFHIQAFLCLHTVNMGLGGKESVDVFITIIISILSYHHNPLPPTTIIIYQVYDYILP